MTETLLAGMRFSTLIWLLDTALKAMAEPYERDVDLTERLEWVATVRAEIAQRMKVAV